MYDGEGPPPSPHHDDDDWLFGRSTTHYLKGERLYTM